MSPDPIKYVDIAAQYAQEKEELLPILETVLQSGQYVGGAEIEAFESEMAAFLSVKHCVALNSGTDALVLALAGLGIAAGDEVITQSNSFIASAAAIAHLGAAPVFADVLPDQSIDPASVREKITSRTKAIMPVHLTGRVGDMDELSDIARQNGLKIVEDAAQAIGSTWRGKMAGVLGDAAGFSAHPLKNLNALGDAGYLTTDIDACAETARLYRNHGMIDRNTVVRWGAVSRMDALQAAVLRYRLNRVSGIIERRQVNAARYRNTLDRNLVYFPEPRPYASDTFHTFVIQTDNRDGLAQHLKASGIDTAIHYPVPIHLQPAASSLNIRPGALPATERQAGRILTLPVHQHLSETDIDRVADAVNGFLRQQEASPEMEHNA
ncbi:MAG: DegT/DnrJ/EryC1/StrS family aminotransferase [Alphaproteobacteria bacterium]